MTTTTVQADVTKDPERQAFEPGWDGKPKRHIDCRWPVGEPTPAGTQVYVELSCYHSTHSKAYVATVLAVQRETRDGYAVWSSLPQDSTRITYERVQRYGKPGLLAFANAALALFREQAANGEHDKHLTGATAPAARFNEAA